MCCHLLNPWPRWATRTKVGHEVHLLLRASTINAAAGISFGKSLDAACLLEAARVDQWKRNLNRSPCLNSFSIAAINKEHKPSTLIKLEVSSQVLRHFPCSHAVEWCDLFSRWKYVCFFRTRSLEVSGWSILFAWGVSCVSTNPRGSLTQPPPSSCHDPAVTPHHFSLPARRFSHRHNKAPPMPSEASFWYDRRDLGFIIWEPLTSQRSVYFQTCFPFSQNKLLAAASCRQRGGMLGIKKAAV